MLVVVVCLGRLLTLVARNSSNVAAEDWLLAVHGVYMEVWYLSVAWVCRRRPNYIPASGHLLVVVVDASDPCSGPIEKYLLIVITGVWRVVLAAVAAAAAHSSSCCGSHCSPRLAIKCICIVPAQQQFLV